MYGGGRCDYGINDVPCSASLNPKALSLSCNDRCLRFYTFDACAFPATMSHRTLEDPRMAAAGNNYTSLRLPICVDIQATCTPSQLCVPECLKLWSVVTRVYQLVQLSGLAELLGPWFQQVISSTLAASTLGAPCI